MSVFYATSAPQEPPAIDWDGVNTVLVDMDGTLLDLAFDNYFWTEFVPAHYAQLHGMQAEDARRSLLERYRAIEGRLAWYCIDHWSEALDLDIRALKRTQRHRVRYLPGAPEFLSRARAMGKRVLLVTNAHPFTLQLKVAQTSLDVHVDDMVSSHDLDAPKESRPFWDRLHAKAEFDPDRTALVEDSLPVLAAATEFGLAATVAIRRPDSRRSPRRVHGYFAVDGVHELLNPA